MQLLSRLFQKSHTRKSDISGLLLQSRKQEAPFEVFFNKEINDLPDATFRLAGIEDDKLCFRVISENFLDPALFGSHFQATFPLSLHKHIQSQVYKFSSRLEDCRLVNDSKIFRTSFPDRLSKVELRKDIRIGLTEANRPALRAWKAGKGTNGLFSSSSFDPAKTCSPTLFEMQPADDGMVLLHNISAGGLKLSISPYCFPEAAKYLNEDSRLHLWMQLPEIGWKHPVECLMPARTTRIQHSPTGRLEFGLHFLHLSGGQIKLPNSDGWVRYTDSSLQILVGWIQRRLEEFDSSERAW